MEKRLYRSRSDRIIWGVCGGLANYFNIDPVLVRIVFVLLVFVNGLGILAYIIMAILIPLEGSKAATPKTTIRENVDEIKQSATGLGDEIRSRFTREDSPGKSTAVARDRRSRNILGTALIVVGIIALMGALNLFWWFRWAFLWPGILIIVGLIIIFAWRR